MERPPAGGEGGFAGCTVLTPVGLASVIMLRLLKLVLSTPSTRPKMFPRGGGGEGPTVLLAILLNTFGGMSIPAACSSASLREWRGVVMLR